MLIRQKELRRRRKRAKERYKENLRQQSSDRQGTTKSRSK